MKKQTTIELYNAVMRDQPCSWVCPMCKHKILLRNDDGIGFIHFKVDMDIGNINNTQISLGAVLYSVSIKCPNCQQFISYIGEYNDCEKRESLSGFNDSPPDYKPNIESMISDSCIYPSLAISDIKYFSHVPKRLQTDYIEMSKLIDISPAAAVVFGRRCLERLIITKWPEIRKERNNNNNVPHLSEMITWLKKNKSEEIEPKSLEAIKIIGDKAVHIFDSESDLAITSLDATLIKEVIEDLFNIYFEEEQKKNERKTSIARRAEEIKNQAKEIEQTH